MKKPTKSIITSSLLAIAFGAMSVGTTFALFTSEASTAIDVQAGVIDLKAPVTVTSAWELGGTPMNGSGFAWTNSIGGSISKDDSNVIHLNKLAPGDGALFALTPDNSGTNVKIKARLVVRLQGELAGALNVEVKAGENTVIAFNGAHTGYTPWQEVAVESNPTAFTVKVEFPDHDGGEILFGSANKDNQYQNKEATLLINYEAVQGNAQTDDVLQVINTKLMSEAYAHGANKTMHDALQDLSEAQVTAIQTRHYVWGAETDQFFDFGQTVPADAYKYFKMFDEMPTTQTYSVYADAETWATTVDLTGIGFDAGSASGITAINYVGADTARENTIRTNSASTALTINAPLDTVHHYGAAGSLNIVAVASNSYHENGKVAFAEVSKGRIVLESHSEIKHVHINKKANVQEFDTVIIKDAGAAALPVAITRDQVDVAEAKAVVTVESGSTSETVYVYPYTDAQETKTGTTEKTATQNTTIASALGQLVLDNGSDAGEKAMSNNDKEETKEVAVETAQVEEAEDAGYVVVHHDALAPTCTTAGHTAYDSYVVDNEEVKIGYKELPALGHTKAENPTYQVNFNGRWQHATQCVVDNAWIVEYCHDENDDNLCDDCGHQMYIIVNETNDLYQNPNYSNQISSGAYKLNADVSLKTLTYLHFNVLIDLNGHTLSNYAINSPADAQFKCYSNANTTFTLTLKDSSTSKTGMFISRYGDTFFDGTGNSGNNKFVLNCLDGVKIDVCRAYGDSAEELTSLNSNVYFLNSIGKDVEINGATIVCDGLAYVNAGYTVRFNDCNIQSKRSSDWNLISGSGSIIFDNCTISTYKGSSTAFDSSSYPTVTFMNGTTVNGVAK